MEGVEKKECGVLPCSWCFEKFGGHELLRVLPQREAHPVGRQTHAVEFDLWEVAKKGLNPLLPLVVGIGAVQPIIADHQNDSGLVVCESRGVPFREFTGGGNENRVADLPIPKPGMMSAAVANGV